MSVGDYRWQSTLWRMALLGLFCSIFLIGIKPRLDTWQFVLASIGLVFAVIVGELIRSRLNPMTPLTAESNKSAPSKTVPTTAREGDTQTLPTGDALFAKPDRGEAWLRTVFFLFCGTILVCGAMVVAGWALPQIELSGWTLDECGIVSLVPLFLLGQGIYFSTKSTSLHRLREESSARNAQVFGRRRSPAHRDLGFVIAALPALWGLGLLMELHQLGPAVAMFAMSAFFVILIAVVNWHYACAIELGKTEFHLYSSMSRVPRVFDYESIQSLEVHRTRHGIDVVRIRLNTGRIAEFAPQENRELQLAVRELEKRVNG